MGRLVDSFRALDQALDGPLKKLRGLDEVVFDAANSEIQTNITVSAGPGGGGGGGGFQSSGSSSGPTVSAGPGGGGSGGSFRVPAPTNADEFLLQRLMELVDQKVRNPNSVDLFGGFTPFGTTTSPTKVRAGVS